MKFEQTRSYPGNSLDTVLWIKLSRFVCKCGQKLDNIYDYLVDGSTISKVSMVIRYEAQARVDFEWGRIFFGGGFSRNGEDALAEFIRARLYAITALDIRYVFEESRRWSRDITNIRIISLISKVAPLPVERGKKKTRRVQRTAKIHFYDDAVYFRFNLAERLVRWIIMGGRFLRWKSFL